MGFENVTPVKFLVVDDDDVDVMSIKRSMRRMNLANPVIVARDGIEALEYLRGEADREKVMPPFIIMLDLNMPRMTGQEFLEAVRSDERLKRVVIFVWSTSDDRRDISAAYSKNVAGYLVKDHDAGEFEKALNMLDRFSQMVVLPDNF